MTLEPKAEAQVQQAASGMKSRFMRHLQEKEGILLLEYGRDLDNHRKSQLSVVSCPRNQLNGIVRANQLEPGCGIA
jgi:hypothetical protein